MKTLCSASMSSSPQLYVIVKTCLSLFPLGCAALLIVKLHTIVISFLIKFYVMTQYATFLFLLVGFVSVSNSRILKQVLTCQMPFCLCLWLSSL